MIHSPQDDIRQKKHSNFLPYIFLYSIISPSNFQLCTNLSRSYSRNPRPPANHSAAAENFTQH